MEENKTNATGETSQMEKVAELQRELAELKQENETLKSEYASREARISELEQTLSSRDGELSTVKQTVVELEKKLASASQSWQQAVTSYKALVVQDNQDIPEELIKGESVEELNDSIAKAKALITKVKQGLEAETVKIRFPAGAPQRTTADLSVLSPREKIQYAIGGKR